MQTYFMIIQITFMVVVAFNIDIDIPSLKNPNLDVSSSEVVLFTLKIQFIVRYKLPIRTS